MLNPSAAYNRRNHQNHADEGCFADMAGTQIAHVNADEKSDRNSSAYGESAPGAVEKGVGHGNPHAGHGNDQNEDNGDSCCQTSGLADFFFGDFRNGFTVMTNRGK